MTQIRLLSALTLVGLVAGLGNAQLIRVKVFDEFRHPVPNATVFFAPVGNQGVLLTAPRRAKTSRDGSVTLLVDRLWSTRDWVAQSIAFWARKGNLESGVEYFRYSHFFRNDDYPPTLNLYLRPTETFPVQIRLMDETGASVTEGWVALMARVRTTGVMTTWIASWRTDKDGKVQSSFRIRRSLLEWLGGDGLRFFVLAWHPQKGWGWRTCNSVELRDMSITLSPPQPVTMHFKNCFGETVAGIKGRLAQIFLPEFPFPVPLPPNPFTFASNEKGALSIPLPKGIRGSWEWSIKTPREIPYRYRSQGNFLLLSPGTNWEIQFHERATRITGKLVDAATGRPLPRYPLLVEFHTGEIISAAGSYWHRTFTDQNGEFEAQVSAPLSKGYIALHLPDGQRLMRIPKQEKHFEGCWRISFPPLPVKPLTSWLVVRTDLLIKEPPSLTKELEKATRRAQLELKERLKRAEVFVAVQALENKEQPRNIFAEAINCKGQKVNLEFTCRRDGIGAAVLIPPSQPVKLKLSDGEWIITALIALPEPRQYDPYRPFGAHFFALLSPISRESLKFLKFDKYIQKVQLSPNQECEVFLSAILRGNFGIFYPEMLRVKFPK